MIEDWKIIFLDYNMFLLIVIFMFFKFQVNWGSWAYRVTSQWLGWVAVVGQYGLCRLAVDSFGSEPASAPINLLARTGCVSPPQEENQSWTQPSPSKRCPWASILWAGRWTSETRCTSLSTLSSVRESCRDRRPLGGRLPLSSPRLRNHP